MIPEQFQRILSKVLILFYFVKVGSLLLLYFVTHPFTKLVKDRRTAPKCLTDPKYGEHRYVIVNGIRLHYVENGDRSKPLLVFIHGFPEFWYSWRHQLLEFSKDYWCVAIDKRGYGDSEKPLDMDAYRMNNITKDIKELVLSLGRERFTLIGHDWGAVITHKFVDEYSSMLDNFITMSAPSADIWVNLVFTEWWQFRHSWYVFFFQNPCIPEISVKMGDLAVFGKAMGSESNKNVTPEDIEAFKYTFGKKLALTPPLNYYRANFLDSQDTGVENLTRGLFILGEKDDYISQATVGLLKEKYQNLETAVVKGARHFIQQENPDEINKLIRQFLKK